VTPAPVAAPDSTDHRAHAHTRGAHAHATGNVLRTGDVDNTRAFAEQNAASARSKSSKHWIKEKKQARRNQLQHAHAQQADATARLASLDEDAHEDEGPFGEVVAIEDDEGGELGDEFVMLGAPALPPRLAGNAHMRDDPSPTFSDGDDEFHDIGGLLGARLATIREE